MNKIVRKHIGSRKKPTYLRVCVCVCAFVSTQILVIAAAVVALVPLMAGSKEISSDVKQLSKRASSSSDNWKELA